MKAKVLIPFRDKETGKLHKKGDIITVTSARFGEILRKGDYIEAVEEATPAKAKAKSE